MKEEFVLIIGYFGCGKIILLIMIVGLNNIFGGNIYFNEFLIVGLGLD